MPLAHSFVMCEQKCMSKPSFKELTEAVVISKGYASDILADKQAPSRALAIHMYRKLGWRHPIIAELTDEQIGVLETIEPWVPTPDRSKQDAA